MHRSVVPCMVLTAGSLLYSAPMQTASVHASVAGERGEQPIHVFCGVGDHLWVPERAPVDSPATIDAMFDWMSRTYGAERMYWRAVSPWVNHMQVGKMGLGQYDWMANWAGHLVRDLKIDAAAVASAKRHGMEIYYYVGLFEHGVQPDVGVIAPYQIEDRLRIEHPEWCPVDRWGQRRSPGPIAFCYPEARQAVIDRLASHVIEMGYDGVNFYTYVENLGLRYLDEFGFNQPIVDEFHKTYPNVNLRADALTLTQAQKEHWYRCRGKFVTQFLRELRAVLAPEGIAISICLDASDPDYVQPWWGKPIPGQGMIHLDWRSWIDEGLVDELWVQLGGSADQMALLDKLLVACEGTPVKLTVRTPWPYDERWAKYVDAGVTPIAVITWANNGIERVSLEPTSVDTLTSPDWRLRVQTLDDIATGKLEANPAAVARLADDPHVLVRRKVAYALEGLKATEHAAVLERLLLDPESSVRIAAAGALATVHRPESAGAIVAALEKNHYFQLKNACVMAFKGMGEPALPVLLQGLESDVAAVREVCVRGLYKLGKTGHADAVFEPLRNVLLDPGQPWQVRCWAITRLVGLRLEVSPAQQQQLVADLFHIIETAPDITTQMHAVQSLRYMASLATPAQKARGRDILAALFREYGDGCERDDAAWGWRVAGNTLVAWSGRGVVLEPMLAQTQDKWLAWLAYVVMYQQQKRTGKFNLVDPAQAVANHRKYAPAFPGWRSW